MKTEELLDALIAESEAENICVCLGKGDKIIKEACKSKNGGTDELTKYDMASVTKILCTTMLSLIAIDRGMLSIEDKVSGFFDCPEDKAEMNIRHLLTHTMGIGHKSLLGDGNTYDNIRDYILRIPSDIPIGSNVLYSCPGFVLLGKILEKIFGKPLNILFDDMAAKPLGLTYTSFLPKDGDFVNSNTEEEKLGAVNDYNCQFLGGVAGNAGIFSNMHDMKKFVQVLLSSCDKLVSRAVFDMAVKNYTQGMDESRGLGFLLVDERYSQTGKLFPCGAIGHCGHTGQSVFVDLKSGLYAIILSDMTISTVKKYGEERYDKVMKNREIIHNSLFEIIKNI